MKINCFAFKLRKGENGARSDDRVVDKGKQFIQDILIDWF
jgi:hypothetical protein